MSVPRRNRKISSRPTSLALAALLLLQVAPIFAQAQEETAPLREESTQLDHFYQQRVVSILNQLMDPKDYTLVISTTLRNDEAKLKELQVDREKYFLPGLTIGDPAGNPVANDILLGLKQKAEIQVILADTVPADRDNLVKDILKTKLKLNEESGDTVTVIRSARKPASITPIPADKLPELSVRMIAFWITVSLLALAGIALWLFKRLEKRKERDRQESEDPQSAKKSAEATDSVGHAHSVDEEAEEKEREKTPEEIEAERDALEMRLAFSKGELTKLVQDYPGIVCRAAEEFITQGRLPEIVNCMEALGWEQSKHLFKEIDGRVWTRIGAALRERDVDPTAEESFNAVHVFHRFALSFVLERAGRDTENPFSFIFQLTNSQRIDLLTQETAENIAFIAIYCSGPQMGELLKGLEQDQQNSVLLNITKIKHLPEAIIQESVENLVLRLERIKAEPSVYADGRILAADFMRSLAPAREEELFQNLMNHHPQEAEKIRHVRVMFQDIPYYPQEMVRKIVESFESEDLMKSLVGYDSAFVDAFLALLPSKKALMIQNDLYHMIEFPPASQCAENRRKICSKIEQEFESQRFSVAEFWKQFDQTEEDTEDSSTAEKVTDVNLNAYPHAVFEEFEDDKGGKGDGEGGGDQAA